MSYIELTLIKHQFEQEHTINHAIEPFIFA